MFIETEETPNPEAMKFIPHQDIGVERSYEITSIEEAEKISPLAFTLFATNGVRQVFITPKFISVTKSGDWDWTVLQPLILTALLHHFASDGPAVLENAKENSFKPTGDPITDQIMIILNDHIKPAVAQDGGDIDFEEFSDGVLHLRMRGACAGCPSSTMTLKHGIENMMRHYVPEVREVVAVE